MALARLFLLFFFLLPQARGLSAAADIDGCDAYVRMWVDGVAGEEDDEDERRRACVASSWAL